MFGTFVTVVVQLIFLFIGFTLVASLLSGTLTLIWGTDWLGILMVTLAASLSVTGLGTITAAAAKNPEQASTIGTIIAMLMAVLGGAFGFRLGPPMEYASVIYWGTDAYTQLAAGVNEYWSNVVILLAVGVLTFGIGLLIFFRRIRNWS
jgi:ABC-type transport system involved in multi-copper enzyme maturation permease subunit